MADDDEKEWDPEDPIEKLQKKQIKLGEKLLEKIEKQEQESEEAKKREQQYAAVPCAPFQAPTFDDLSVSITKAWTETKRIVPDAPDHVKTFVFQSLLSAMEHGRHAGPFG